jgi:hypothetical protein
MASNDRLWRREAPEGHEPREPAAAPAPDVASILALQRSAGNRALQRLLHVADTGKLMVPPAYGNQLVQWDGARLRDPARADPVDKTLAALANANPTFRGYLAQGLNVDAVNSVTVADERAMRKATWEQSVSPEKDALAEARAVAPDQNRLLHFQAAWDKFSSIDTLDVRHVISSPQDFVPGKNDLLDAGKPLSTHTGGAKTNTGWKMACVLIALVKHEADFATKVRTITRKTPSSWLDAIQILHDHYAGQGVMYDDTATRFELMNAWGYTPIFTAGCPWTDVPKHVSLSTTGKYIFDIEGHTVVVRPTKNITQDGSTIADPKKAFKPDSYDGNYKVGEEYNHAIKFIWKKD